MCIVHMSGLMRTRYGMAEISKEYWEGEHNDNNFVNLSGSNLDVTSRSLFVLDRVVPGHTVLDIGVGTGACTRDLVAAGLITHSLDIAEAALLKLGGISTCWLESDIEKLPNNHFDLAMSNLVAQHLNDEQLKRHLRNVIRSLKMTGVFAMQYATPLEGKQETEVLAAPPDYAATRFLPTMQRLVKECGGQVVFNELSGSFEHIAWAVVHVVRPRVKFL